MNHVVEQYDERREANRRGVDQVRYWLPIVLAVIGMLVTAGVTYGHIQGKLDLIDYRLQEIELRLNQAPR